MINADILQLLRTQICEVVFEKKDGSERHMICTLKPDFLPNVSIYDFREDRAQKDYMPVYDLEEQAWRAFKPSKLVSIEASLE
jgi:hypothetical protein